MHECPHINVLSLETSSCLNFETEPRMKWYGDGETEPMENLHMGNGISALAIMKKSKNGCNFINICIVQKNLKLLMPQSLGLWFPECQQKWNISISHYEKMKKMATILKMYF